VGSVIDGFVHVAVGDGSLAAIVAAVASVANGLILSRAHRTQRTIRRDLDAVVTDTETRERQIAELRSLSMERLRHISRLARVADRLETMVDPGRPGGRRRTDPEG
jgi:flagellar biosynthesis component FlhA